MTRAAARRAAAAERVRACRSRAAAGRCVLLVEAEIGELADWLVDNTPWLQQWDSEDRAAIADAVSRLLEALVAGKVLVVDRNAFQI